MGVGAVQHPLRGSALEALVVSLASAGVVVAALAFVKARAAHISSVRNANEAALCGAAAAAGYLVGWLGEAWIR